ncbi:MAG: DUF2238 domain-containing protein [Planctomycetota bacterium]|nr:DUF2238 domain-containing protein [Planctomycetota bacterium]
MEPGTPPTPTRASLLPVGLFTAAYMAIAAVAALRVGNTEFVFYLVAMVVMILLVALVHTRVRLATATLWCLSVWGAMHMAGGLMPIPASWPHKGEGLVLYNLWLIPERIKYDQLTHAYGFGVCTWVCWQGLCRLTSAAQPTFGRLALAGLAAMGLGAMNEVIEFAATLSMPETNVGGYRNTGWDLVANLTGIVIAALWIRAATKRG